MTYASQNTGGYSGEENRGILGFGRKSMIEKEKFYERELQV